MNDLIKLMKVACAAAGVYTALLALRKVSPEAGQIK